MSNLLDDSSEAKAWLERASQRHSTEIFGKLVSAVIWTDARDDDGKLVVPVDPSGLVSSINSNPHILLHNHDPGMPKGQVLESALFVTETGVRFVAAILGFYAGGDVRSFSGLGIDTRAPVPSPSELPILPNGNFIELAVDPREVDEAWLDEVSDGAPLRIERSELSHNSAESPQELIRIGLAYVLIVWNPFITAIASEAGKATYAATYAWLRRLFKKMAERRSPVLDIQTSQDGCQVSFLFRGKEVKQHYAAHEALANAAAQAAQLVKNFRERGMPGRQLIYEFDKEALVWFPSYAVLHDGRIVTDSATLISIEQLPSGLSLGLGRGARSPSTRIRP